MEDDGGEGGGGGCSNYAVKSPLFVQIDLKIRQLWHSIPPLKKICVVESEKARFRR